MLKISAHVETGINVENYVENMLKKHVENFFMC